MKISKKKKRNVKLIVVKSLFFGFLMSLTVLIISNVSTKKFSDVADIKDNRVEKASYNKEDKSSIFTKLKDDINRSQVDNTIIFYAEKYKLNISKTLEIAHELSGNYQSDYYLSTNAIVTETNKNRVGSFDSQEAGIVYFVKDLYAYPERYNSSIAEIRASEEISTERTIIDGRIYLANSYTFEGYLKKICNLYSIDPYLALAIAYHESGMLKSYLAVNANNIAGLKGGYGWMRFTTLEAGIISFVLSLRSIIRNNNLDMSTENAIWNLSAIYVNGNASYPSQHWTEKINYYMEYIREKNLFDE